MEKKKLVFINNHFQYSDGTVRALINLVNNLDPEKFEITIKALYRCDFDLAKELHSNIKLEKCFGFYFQGFNRIVNLFSPKHWYKKFIKEKYDIEIAFQCDLPTKIVGASLNERAVHVEWMHGYGLCEEPYRKADKVVCVSKYNAERCLKEMNNEVNVTYCYNLNDDKIIFQKACEPIVPALDFSSKKKPLFVTVGRLSPEKGYVRLVKIFKILRDEGYDFSLVIIGDGEEKSAIESVIKKNNMTDEIFMTGALNNPHNVTKQADCFICSSYSEGYSTACTEAAILGIPIISTSVPGGAEIINDCRCGLLTDIDDNSLLNGIRRVLQNLEIIEQWKSTLSFTKETFSLKNRVKELNALFDSFYILSQEK